MHRRDQLARSEFAIRLNGLRQPVASKFFTLQNYALRSRHQYKAQHFAGFSRQVILMITSIPETFPAARCRDR